MALSHCQNRAHQSKIYYQISFFLIRALYMHVHTKLYSHHTLTYFVLMQSCTHSNCMRSFDCALLAFGQSACVPKCILLVCKPFTFFFNATAKSLQTIKMCYRDLPRNILLLSYILTGRGNQKLSTLTVV